jgi:hypothetical protein
MQSAVIPEGRSRLEFQNRSLFDIWRRGDAQHPHGISMADPEFPWIDTDYSGSKETPDEMPQGSFGYWLLQRRRAVMIAKNEILAPPDERAMPSILSVTGKRDWEKLGMINPGNLNPITREPDNSFAWKVLADIGFFVSGQRLPEALRFFSKNSQEKTATAPTETGGLYLEHCLSAGLISTEEKTWLQNRFTQ